MSLVTDVMSAVGQENTNGSRTSGGSYQQYEPCKVKGCKYLNEEGFCSKETCVVLNENPATAMLITKTCIFCGTKFTANRDSMVTQICPQCLDEAFLATSRGAKKSIAELNGMVNVADEKLKSMKKTKGGMMGGIDISNLAGDIEALNEAIGFEDDIDLAEGMDEEELEDDMSGSTGGHMCMFCGSKINQNPSLFFPCCSRCFTNLEIVTTECSAEILSALAGCSPDNLELAGTASHCYACDD